MVTSDSWSRQEDDGLCFLSREEQECLQFFEKTIDSLEESLEENDQPPEEEKKPTARSRGVQEVDGRPSSTPSPSALLSTLHSRFHSSKDHDIIDLVRPQPNPVQSRAMDFNPRSPGSVNIITCQSNPTVVWEHQHLHKDLRTGWVCLYSGVSMETY